MDRFSEQELSTALMALRAIAYQAENDRGHYSAYPDNDPLDNAEIQDCEECLEVLLPAIRWIENRLEKMNGRRLDQDQKLNQLWLEMKKYKESP
jgi:hypothetical protein